MYDDEDDEDCEEPVLLQYSCHHMSMYRPIVCELLSGLEFHGFVAPRKWTIFVLCPNLQVKGEVTFSGVPFLFFF